MTRSIWPESTLRAIHEPAEGVAAAALLAAMRTKGRERARYDAFPRGVRRVFRVRLAEGLAGRICLQPSIGRSGRI